MRSQEEIEREVISLQSHVASLDILIDRRSRWEDDDMLAKRAEFNQKRDKLLRKIQVLEWTLGREPAL
jgi:hypothetical protein